MTTDPSGRYFYTSGGGGITGFSIDSNSGNLTQIGSPAPSLGATVLTYVQ